MHSALAAGTTGTTVSPVLRPVVVADRRLRIIPLADTECLRIEGALDYTTRAALAHALASTPRDRDLYLELAGLEFVDVAGLCVLVTAANRLQEGHILRLRSASRQVRRLLDLVGWRGTPRIRLEDPAPQLRIAPARRLWQISLSGSHLLSWRQA